MNEEPQEAFAFSRWLSKVCPVVHRDTMTQGMSCCRQRWPTRCALGHSEEHCDIPHRLAQCSLPAWVCSRADRRASAKRCWTLHQLAFFPISRRKTWTGSVRAAQVCPHVSPHPWISHHRRKCVQEWADHPHTCQKAKRSERGLDSSSHLGCAAQWPCFLPPGSTFEKSQHLLVMLQVTN